MPRMIGPWLARGRSWPIWTLPRAAVVFLLLVDGAALVVTGSSVSAPTTVEDAVEWAALVTLGLAAAEMTRQVERRRRRFSNTPHVNFSSVWTLAAALLLPPALAAALVVVLYLHLWCRSWRGVSGIHAYRVLFSASNVVLSCQVAGWAGRQLNLVPPGAERNTVTAASLVGVIGLYFVVNSAVVATAIVLIKGRTSLAGLLGPVNENLLELATLCMGALTALLLVWWPSLVVVIFLPLYALHRTVLIRQFEQAATTDAKTGLLNAASWTAIGEAEIERSREYGTEVALLLMDVEYLVEGRYQADCLVPDAVLRQVGDALRDEIRGDDLCGRLGGAEFAALLPGIQPDRLVSVAQRIRLRIIDACTKSSDQEVGVCVSVGAALFPGVGRTLQELLTAADNALFTAKDSGCRDQILIVEETD